MSGTRTDTIRHARPAGEHLPVSLPLIRPILAYTLITSIIGGLQMFDVPQILTNGQGTPDRCAMTLIMFLNSHLRSKNYGMGGALSVYLFLVSGILCWVVYRMTNDPDPDGSKAAERRKKRMEKRQKAAEKAAKGSKKPMLARLARKGGSAQ